jgi:hypothetical protein
MGSFKILAKLEEYIVPKKNYRKVW